jgi:hypothetical protein
MNFWWLSDSARVGVEKAAIEQLAATESWFTFARWTINAYRFSVEGTISAHAVDYPIRLFYPDQYPLVPAWVEPQDPEARWSRHQYGNGGCLCLELRPDNWTPEATGADVLRSAHNLLVAENPLGEGERCVVSSAHINNAIQSYDWLQEPIMIGSGCIQRIRDGVAEGIIALRWMCEDSVWPIMVFDSIDRTQPRHPPSVSPSFNGVELPVVIARAKVGDTAPTNRAELSSIMQSDLSVYSPTHGLVALIADEDQIIPFHSTDSDSVYIRKLYILPDEIGTRSGRSATATGKNIAIVGLGSVGSKISEMVLRSGITRLLLIDGDVFLPANLERHILDWRDVGFRKANATRRRLMLIDPNSKISIIAANLNWQRSAKTQADYIDQLAGCDLIVDATGDTATSLFLGAIAAANKKAFVSTVVFEGGLGALIARSLPGRDPSYNAGRSAYCAYCEKENTAPPRSGHKAYEALAESGDPLVADDAAVSVAASHAARIILDILDEKVDPSDNPWLLIGLRKGWLFRKHGDTISLDVGNSSPLKDIIEDTEACAFALAIAKEALDATAYS